jgi:hypothetical protein
MWATWIVILVLIGYIISETLGSKLREGFAIPRRMDIGATYEGWTHEETGYIRDIRYAETYTDVQKNGVAADFCRAVYKKGDPASLHIACALATREHMDTMEYKSSSIKDGFRFSRDDYWRDVNGDGRMDYCRILRDEDTGGFISTCAISTAERIGPREERDTEPPPVIRQLLESYEDCLVWFRFQDDTVDYAGNAVLEYHGRPEIPTLIHPLKTRGIQFNRYSPEAPEKVGPPTDYFTWGERGNLHLDQDIAPSQIRAISFWIWLDSFTNTTRVMECSNPSSKTVKDLVWIGVESTGRNLLPALPNTVDDPALELRADEVYRLGQQVEPVRVPDRRQLLQNTNTNQSTWVFEIWDQEQPIMRLSAPHTARTGKWQHVAITTTDSTSWWPTWQIWIDGVKQAEKKDGRLIPALYLTQNKLGLLSGCLQDFRIYKKPLTAAKLQSTITYARMKLHPNP